MSPNEIYSGCGWSSDYAGHIISYVHSHKEQTLFHFLKKGQKNSQKKKQCFFSKLRKCTPSTFLLSLASKGVQYIWTLLAMTANGDNSLFVLCCANAVPACVSALLTKENILFWLNNQPFCRLLSLCTSKYSTTSFYKKEFPPQF